MLYPPLRALSGATGWIGRRVEPAALEGRAALVVFFAHEGAGCRAALRQAEALHRALGAAGLAVVGVHEPAFGADVRAEAEDALRALGVTFPVALDARGAAWDAFDARLLPAWFLADAEGALRHARFGEGGLDRLREKAEALLNAQARSASPPRAPGSPAPSAARTPWRRGARRGA
jgi:AhpC/TSA family